MLIKALVFIITLLISGSIAAQFTSQSIAYYYDDAGNRKKREQCACVGNRPANPTDSTTNNTLEANILPNPTKGNLAIKVTEEGIDLGIETPHFHVIVYDREILNEQHTTATFNIDITQQSVGAYFVKLFTANKVKHWEIIKD